jgi:hypothetical protein
MIANGRQTVADICLQLGGSLEALPGLLGANAFASLTAIPADAAQVVRLLGGVTISTGSATTAAAIGTAAIGSTFIIT